MGQILPFTIETDNGRLGPAWTLYVALQIARRAEKSGRRVVCIDRGPERILEGEALRRAMDEFTV